MFPHTSSVVTYHSCLVNIALESYRHLNYHGMAQVPVFISEIAPKDLRGGLASSNQLFICSGCSAAYIIGALLSWRSLVLVGKIYALSVL
jgi:hypothetical protein